MGTLPFEPFDEELLGPLAPHCKIIASGSAGYNEFDVDWMTRSKIWFCNTRNAVSEATADMSMFLILAVLKNATVAERSAREGRWKDGLVPTKDPRGLTLGIVGMGSIGKVGIWTFFLLWLIFVVGYERPPLFRESNLYHVMAAMAQTERIYFPPQALHSTHYYWG